MNLLKIKAVWWWNQAHKNWGCWLWNQCNLSRETVNTSVFLKKKHYLCCKNWFINTDISVPVNSGCRHGPLVNMGHIVFATPSQRLCPLLVILGYNFWHQKEGEILFQSFLPHCDVYKPAGMPAQKTHPTQFSLSTNHLRQSYTSTCTFWCQIVKLTSILR